MRLPCREAKPERVEVDTKTGTVFTYPRKLAVPVMLLKN